MQPELKTSKKGGVRDVDNIVEGTMSRSTFSVLFYVNRGKEKGGTTRLSVSGRVPRHCANDTWWLVGIGIDLFFCMFLLTSKIYDQSKEIEELQLAGWKYRALRATLPANNANVIWLECNVWAGNKDGIRHCQQFVINYEDSFRRRYEMIQDAAMRDSIGRLMIQQSQDIKKKLK